MNEKDLLTGEHIITQSGGNLITLTNYRVRMTTKRFGKADIVSIPLQKVSTVEVNYHSVLIALILGVLFLVVGLLMASGGRDAGPFGAMGALLGIIGIAYYYLTRKHVILISADNGRGIQFESKGLSQDAINKFINQVEGAVRDERSEK